MSAEARHPVGAQDVQEEKNLSPLKKKKKKRKKRKVQKAPPSGSSKQNTI